jgi:hypothetical protein
MTDNEQTLTPMEEKTLEFYDDELVAAKMADGSVFVPVRRLCDNLGLDWPSQRQRILRDEILNEAKGVVIITTPGGQQEALCLPLDLIPGWLFGVQPSRVREDLRPKLRRYRKECFRVLWNAFKSDIMQTPEPKDMTPAEQALAQAEMLVAIARQQVIFERILIEHGGRLDVLDSSLEAARQAFAEVIQKLHVIELRVYGPNEIISDPQAAEIAATVAALANRLTELDPSKNHYQGIWGELHRRYKVATYSRVPAARFGEVIAWLESWLASGRTEPLA